MIIQLCYLGEIEKQIIWNQSLNRLLNKSQQLKSTEPLWNSRMWTMNMIMGK